MPSLPVPAAEARRQREQRQRLRRCVMGLVFGIPLLLLACALYLAFGPKPPPPPVVLPVTPQRTAQAEAHIDAVRRALTDPPPSPFSGAAITATTAPPQPDQAAAQRTAAPPVQHMRGPDGEDLITMRLSQADLNAYLSGDGKLKDRLESKGVHAVSVELVPPSGLILHVNATLRGITDNALIAATLTPDPQTAVRLNVTDARFGRLPPPVVKAAVDHIAGEFLINAGGKLPLTVRKIEVVGDDLVLSGVGNAINSAKR